MEDTTLAASPVEQDLSTQGRAADSAVAGMLSALRRLDRLLEAAMSSDHGADTSAPFRGLFLCREDVSRLLKQDPMATPFSRTRERAGEDLLGITKEDSPLAWLIEALGLGSFDAHLVLLALAPEVDLKYEKIFGYLQNDVNRRRPTVELALNLLCTTANEKLIRQRHFSPDAPLIRHKVLYIVPDPNQLEAPYLACYLKLDEQITHLLLGRCALGARVAPFYRALEPGASPDEVILRRALRRGTHSIPSRSWGAKYSLLFKPKERSSGWEVMPGKRLQRGTAPAAVRTAKGDYRAVLLPAISYIEENYPEKVALGVVAQLCGLGRYQFSRIFKRVHGTTFREFLIVHRIKKAMRLLARPGASVTDAAFAVGFNDLSDFAQMFRRYIGVCPSDYLHEMKKSLR